MSQEIDEHIYNAGRGNAVTRVVGMLVSMLFTMSYFFPFLHFLSLVPALYFYPYSVWSWLYALAFVAVCVFPGYASPAIAGSRVFQCMLNYFDWSLIQEPTRAVLASKNYIYAVTPHGVLSVGGIAWGIYASAIGLKLPVTAVASVVTSIPYVKQIVGLFPSVDASRKSLVRTLKNNSVVLYTGGIAELYFSCAKEERLFIRERKGFIKLALQTGSDVVPVYIFGNTATLHVLKNEYLANLSRRIGASITLMWGRWGLPVPKPVKVITVVGNPLGMPQIEDPTQEDIDTWHAKYVESVVELYNKYKEKHPDYANKPLIIN